MATYTDEEVEIWRELKDFAEKASGEGKHVWPPV